METAIVEVFTEEPRAPVSIEDVLRAIGTHRKQVYLVLMAACAGASFLEQVFLPTMSTTSMWAAWPELEENRTYYNIVFAVGNVARLLGSLLIIPAQDVLGRRPLITFCLCAQFVTTALSALAPTFEFYVMARALSVLVVAALPSACTIFVLEVVAASKRALPPTLLQIANMTAVIYLSGANQLLTSVSLPYGIPSWRFLQLCGLAPTVLGLIFLFITWIETPRFQLSQGNMNAAWNTLIRLCPGGERHLSHWLGGSSPHAVSLCSNAFISLNGSEYGEGSATRSNVCAKMAEHLRRTRVSVMEVVVHDVYKTHIIKLGLLWGVTAIAYWGTVTYVTAFFERLDLVTNWATLAVFSIQIPGLLLSYRLMEWSRAGRIVALRSMASLCCAGQLCLGVFLLLGYRNQLAIWCLVLATFFFAGPMWNSLYIYSTEIFPTSHRGAAMALLSTVTAASSFVTTFVGSYLVALPNLCAYPLTWAGCFALALGICISLSHETRGRPLVDVM